MDRVDGSIPYFPSQRYPISSPFTPELDLSKEDDANENNHPESESRNE